MSRDVKSIKDELAKEFTEYLATSNNQRFFSEGQSPTSPKKISQSQKYKNISQEDKSAASALFKLIETCTEADELKNLITIYHEQNATGNFNYLLKECLKIVDPKYKLAEMFNQYLSAINVEKPKGMRFTSPEITQALFPNEKSQTEATEQLPQPEVESAKKNEPERRKLLAEIINEEQEASHQEYIKKIRENKESIIKHKEVVTLLMDSIAECNNSDEIKALLLARIEPDAEKHDYYNYFLLECLKKIDPKAAEEIIEKIKSSKRKTTEAKGDDDKNPANNLHRAKSSLQFTEAQNASDQNGSMKLPRAASTLMPAPKANDEPKKYSGAKSSLGLHGRYGK